MFTILTTYLSLKIVFCPHNNLKKEEFSSKMEGITYIGENYCLQYLMYHCVSVIENYLMK